MEKFSTQPVSKMIARLNDTVAREQSLCDAMSIVSLSIDTSKQSEALRTLYRIFDHLADERWKLYDVARWMEEVVERRKAEAVSPTKSI